jgi:methylthioribose-1-phosphate isomerase
MIYLFCMKNIGKRIQEMEQAHKKTLLAIKYNAGQLQILNQLKLPHHFEYEDCSDCEKGFAAIKEMKVRGAPAIAITALLSLACEVNQKQFASKIEFQNFIFEKLEYLCQSRPTAVNLFKMAEEAKSRVLKWIETENNTKKLINLFEQYALHFFEQDIATNKKIGEFGARAILEAVTRRGLIQGAVEQLLEKNSPSLLNILTHCNTGALATAGHGTALGVIRDLFAQEKIAHVYATETRPYNQGARLTAFELVYDKIPSTLVTDSMISFLMKEKKIDAVVVGADRVALNGDTANKIGTYQIAIAAAYHNVPFFVAAPTTSIDFYIASGNDIHVEERPAKELTHIQNIEIAAPGIGVWNPSFDVTPHHLITGIITENGVFYKDKEGLFSLAP